MRTRVKIPVVCLAGPAAIAVNPTCSLTRGAPQVRDIPSAASGAAGYLLVPPAPAEQQPADCLAVACQVRAAARPL
jgi:hypothetical protein